MTKVIIGDCTLYLGDALEILPTLPKSDLLLTDAPYLLTSGGNSDGENTMSGIFSYENYDNKGHIVECNITFQDMATPLYNALKDNADAYVMANDKNQFEAQRAFLEAKFKFHNPLTWDKGNAVPNRWYMKNQEYVLYLWKGIAKTINNPSCKQNIFVPNTKYTKHPTEKPVSLMQYYIENSSQYGDVVLDAFMGTGSTGVAALQSGRKFVGIEIDQKWFDVACERIEKFQSNFQLSLLEAV